MFANAVFMQIHSSGSWMLLWCRFSLKRLVMSHIGEQWETEQKEKLQAGPQLATNTLISVAEG